MMTHLSLRAFEQVCKKTGVGRVSREALEEIRDVIEEIAIDAAEQSARIARHAGRNTVRKDDVMFVIKKDKIS